MKKRILIAALAVCMLFSFAGCTQSKISDSESEKTNQQMSSSVSETENSNSDSAYSHYIEIDEEMSQEDIEILQSIQPQIHGEGAGMTPTTDTPYKSEQLSALHEGMTYDDFCSILGDNGRDGNYTYDIVYSPIDVTWVDSNGTILLTSFENGVCTYLDIIDRSVE